MDYLNFLKLNVIDSKTNIYASQSKILDNVNKLKYRIYSHQFKHISFEHKMLLKKELSRQISILKSIEFKIAKMAQAQFDFEN